MSAPNIDYYALLHVHPSATLEQVRAAYLRQIGQWHPDRNATEEATRRTAQINAAWEVLRDPSRRAAYDRQRRHAGGGQPAPADRHRQDRTPRPRQAAVDPAAAERARRGAEASARESQARKQREAEYERRRRASEPLWQPPDERGYGWSDQAFVVGHWYRNNRGPYRLIDVRGKYADVYYTDGDIVSLPADDLWRHWQHQVQRRSGAGRTTSTRARH
ncbi:MAG: J domain-containing protein [Dehalococcoidia bacterium]